MIFLRFSLFYFDGHWTSNGHWKLSVYWAPPRFSAFEDWKLKVDDIVFSKLNLNCSDLPDEDYWMSWDKDFSPEKIWDQKIT